MRRTPFTPTLIGAVLIVVGVLAWFGYQWIAERRSVAEQRAKLLVAVDEELARDPVDSGELSLLMAQIRKLEDHVTASDLLRAQARIEFARGRAERARDLLLPTASLPGAAPADQALAARILLQVQAVGARDRGTAVTMLEQALAFATAAHAVRGEPADLLPAWIAAVRLADADRTRELAEQIRSRYEGTPEARLVGANLDSSASDLEALKAQFADPPPEVDALLAVVELKSGNVEQAVRLVESLLGRGGGIVDVRVAAYAVFHACAMGSPEGGADRERWLVRRDAQLSWLLDNAAPDDGRRETWAALKRQR